MLYEMLTAAVNSGLLIVVISDPTDDADYVGTNVRDAIEAIEAVDEAEVELLDEDSEHGEGWALIVNGLDEDERIADCSGWVDRWCDSYDPED